MNKRKFVSGLQKALAEDDRIVFAYLHGSFLDGDKFNDVDIALYLDENEFLKIVAADFEIALSLRVEKSLGLPVDVKILNHAPLSFRYHATRGYLLFCRNDSTWEEFLCRTWGEYFDFKPVSDIYLKEIFFASI